VWLSGCKWRRVCGGAPSLLIMGGRPPASLLDVVIYSGVELTVGVLGLCRVFRVQVRLAPV
jgi:hypothetical protein